LSTRGPRRPMRRPVLSPGAGDPWRGRPNCRRHRPGRRRTSPLQETCTAAWCAPWWR